MKLTRKKILVTGADGFIGSHLVEVLVERGFDVRAFVFYNSFGSWGWLDEASDKAKRSIEVFPGDIRDPHAVENALKDCDVVFHLAALISIPYSYRSPDAYVDTNIKGTLNVLRAARKYGIKKVIHTSTSEVYGTAQFIPISEEHPLNAQSPYAATKIGADQLALSFHRSFDVPVAVLRPFNTYGPRQSARAIIPTIITQLAIGQKKIRLGALQPTRDFSYVGDTVSAFIATAESDKSMGHVLNAGSNFEISMGDTAHLIARLMKKKATIQADQSRIRPKASEVERLLADTSKIKKMTNWKPSHQGFKGFEKGLEKTIRWFTQKKNLSRYKTEIFNF